MNDENENRPQDNHEGLNPENMEGEESLSLETGRPAVASAPGKIMVFVIVGAIFIAIVVKSLFFGAAPPPDNKVGKRRETVVQAAAVKATSMAPGELPTPPVPEPVDSYSSPISKPDGSGGVGGPDLSKLPPPPASKGAGAASTPSFSMPSPVGLGTPSGTAAGGIGNVSAPTIAPPPSLIAAPPPLVGSGGAKSAVGSTAGGASAPPPPPPPNLAQPELPAVKTSMPKDENAIKRNQADSTLISNSAAANAAANKAAAAAAKSKSSTGFTGNDPNSQFMQAEIARSHADTSTAERIDNLGYTIIQGKIINGVLETAISSDLPGTLRAVVSHDVYAEAGRAILVPKGSRLIGTYNAAVKRGQTRVLIVWTRIIRPDGITIDVDSSAVDNLGRAGLDGDVDNKYVEMFSTALLTSSLDIGLAAIGNGLFGSDQSTTTTNGSGGTTTTSNSSSTAMQEAVSNMGQIGKTIVGNALAVNPTVSIDQGTPVNIFVNRELVFPPSVTMAGVYSTP